MPCFHFVIVQHHVALLLYDLIIVKCVKGMMRYMKSFSLFLDLPKLDAFKQAWFLGLDVGAEYVGLTASGPHNKIALLSLGYFVELDLRLMCVVHLPLFPLLRKVCLMNSQFLLLHKPSKLSSKMTFREAFILSELS